jgi:hypothetical protein
VRQAVSKKAMRPPSLLWPKVHDDSQKQTTQRDGCNQTHLFIAAVIFLFGVVVWKVMLLSVALDLVESGKDVSDSISPMLSRFSF